jgi:hypothetical protein
MNNNNNTNYDIDEEQIGKPYTGPTKLVWENRRQIRRPDLSSSSTSTPVSGSNNKEFKYQKSLDEIISDVDKKRFEKLPNDEDRYQFICNMITTGEENNNPNQLFPSRYIKGDPRSLVQILEDLIEQKKIYFDSFNSGNLFSYDFAIREKMISFKCRSCSKVLFSEQGHRIHQFSHQSASE